MEPVYMTMGHASGIAATMGIGGETAVQDIAVETLRAKLVEQKAVLELKGLADLITVAKLEGVAIDDKDAEFIGSWSHSSYGNPIEGSAAHDGNGGKGEKSATFVVEIPVTGQYEIRFAYAASPNRASAVPVTIEHDEGTASVTVDERKVPEHDELFTTLGTWSFSKDKPAILTVRNDGTDSYVSVDAIQFIPMKQ